MLKIHQIKCPVDAVLSVDHIAKKLHCSPKEILSFEIDRQSLDARSEELHYSYSVYATVQNEKKYLRLKDVSQESPERYELPNPPKNPAERPIVVGFGPAGMYAALILAEVGLRPIVLERGRNVDERTKDVTSFFQEGLLDPISNVQFGEGGAGTFSDGKLTTRIKNYRIRKVLEEFIEAGANPAILYQQRAHLGTDVLRTIVKNIRTKIIELGGEVHFETQVLSLLKDSTGVIGVHTNQEDFHSRHVILAIGHSAADTFSALYEQGLLIEQKDFAAGVRVEHPQTLINRNQYGTFANHPALSAASYQLTAKTSTKRGVYSFCMCPGGVVVPASTEDHCLAVNGMSYSLRDGKNANSAILVQIPRSDFDQGHPLDGFRYQKMLEQRAYRDKFQAPAMNIRDFIHHSQTTDFCLESSYPRGLVAEDMHLLFSDAVNQSLEEGFRNFERKIKGFSTQGIMVGMESRSSSPIKVPRDEHGVSLTLPGVYPTGEGAGYAGGIVSSAVDGIKVAEFVIQDLDK